MNYAHGLCFAMFCCPLVQGNFTHSHYNDVIMSMMASQITSLTIVYSIVYSGAVQRKHQTSEPLAFVWGIHRRPVNSPHKWPVTRKMLHLMTSSCLDGHFADIIHPVPMKKPWGVWVNALSESTKSDKTTTTRQHTTKPCVYWWNILYMADSRLACSQWETSLQSNGVSHWLGANLESALLYTQCKLRLLTC